jgi:hypothetical protein
MPYDFSIDCSKITSSERDVLIKNLKLNHAVRQNNDGSSVWIVRVNSDSLDCHSPYFNFIIPKNEGGVSEEQLKTLFYKTVFARLAV